MTISVLINGGCNKEPDATAVEQDASHTPDLSVDSQEGIGSTTPSRVPSDTKSLEDLFASLLDAIEAKNKTALALGYAEHEADQARREESKAEVANRSLAQMQKVVNAERGFIKHFQQVIQEEEQNNAPPQRLEQLRAELTHKRKDLESMETEVAMFEQLVTPEAAASRSAIATQHEQAKQALAEAENTLDQCLGELQRFIEDSGELNTTANPVEVDRAISKSKEILDFVDSRVRAIGKQETEKAAAARQALGRHMQYMAIKQEHDAMEQRYKFSLEELDKAESSNAASQQIESFRASVVRYKKRFEAVQQELVGLEQGDEILLNAQYKAAERKTELLDSCLRTAKAAHQKALQAQKSF
ncbi:MAG: hypothetical protein AAF085_00240 [Planctomycetota bacterium]